MNILKITIVIDQPTNVCRRMLTSGSSLTNFTITRNPGDENLCYFKNPGSTLVLESCVRLFNFTQMAVSNLMFLVFLCHELVLNGEVVSSLM